MPDLSLLIFFFFFNDTATTEIYTLSLHDALPIPMGTPAVDCLGWAAAGVAGYRDRKSTRLNSSHSSISYAVFCLKKKNKHKSIFLHKNKKKKIKKKNKLHKHK